MISELSEGMVFGSYKALCKFLGENVKNGCSKISQIAEWNRWFKFNKEGNKFIILEVYEQPMIKKSINGIYSEYVKSLVLDLLEKELDTGKNRVVITGNRLLYALNMVNESYIKHKYNYKELSSLLDIKEDYVNDFYFTTNGKLVSTLRSSLKSLMNSKLIQYNILMVLNTDDGNIEPTVKQRDIILTLEKEALNSFMCNTYTDILRKGFYDKYMEKVRQLLKMEDELIGVNSWYYCYDIVFINALRKERKQLYKLLELDRKGKREELNTLLVNNYKESYNDRQLKVKGKDAIIWESLSKWDELRLKDDYVSNGSMLVDYTIKR